MKPTTSRDAADPILSAQGKQRVREGVQRAVRALVRGGENVRDLAARLDVVPGTVDRWASGLGFPNFTAAKRIAPLVGVDPETGARS